jgi:predicted SnoaL-like aldol condensation-catalyzing enzyme
MGLLAPIREYAHRLENIMPTTTQENIRIAETALRIAFSPEYSMAQKREQLPHFINTNKYIQHSAVVPDGYEGLISLIENVDASARDYAIRIKRSIAQDDLVFVHCHYFFGNGDVRGKAIAEVFRVEDGLLVEHWDVIQDVPESFANANGMF